MRITLVAGIVLLIATPLAAQEQTRVAGYETYAVVAPTADAAQALPFAERHCAKYDRFASFKWMDGSRAIFDCTPERVVKQPEPRPRGIY
jgi:hypothetical protein